jgi:hypothetical protein
MLIMSKRRDSPHSLISERHLFIAHDFQLGFSSLSALFALIDGLQFLALKFFKARS